MPGDLQDVDKPTLGEVSETTTSSYMATCTKCDRGEGASDSDFPDRSRGPPRPPPKPAQHASGRPNPRPRAVPFSMFSLNIERAKVFAGEKIKCLAES